MKAAFFDKTGGPEVIQELGLQHESGETGQHAEVRTVIAATDEEKDVGQAAVRSLVSASARMASASASLRRSRT